MGQIYRDIANVEFEQINQRIIYEDNHILVFNKNVGEIVQGDKTGDEPLSETLKAFIAKRDAKPGNVFMGVVHRLDRPVSGVIVFAKTSKSLSRLNIAIRDGKMHKRYWALLEAAPKPEQASLVHYLARNEAKNKSVAHINPCAGAKEARLNYQLLRATKSYFLVEVELITGRHHQIRCQLSKIGCPIKGDLKYGARRSNQDGGISLHSRHLTLSHPTTKQEMTFTAPTPMEQM